MTTLQKSGIILLIICVVNILVFFGIRHFHKSRQVTLEPRRSGIGGPAIEAFDKRTDRWIEEMKAESIEESFALLNDLNEYGYSRITEYPAFDLSNIEAHEDRDKRLYQYMVPQSLSNRRFLKALEDLKKLSRRKCIKLLTQCIDDNLKEKIRL
ncbi:MAG: hypothetical protein LBB88_08345 [Planctomycetaceae bacterium]|jgi:hypothetical protein|nr:hypothetical protein [Planctomycetaceae bacterium]